MSSIANSLPPDSPLQDYIKAYGDTKEALTAAQAAGVYLPAEQASQLANAGVGLYGEPGTWFGPGAAQTGGAPVGSGAGSAGATAGVFNAAYYGIWAAAIADIAISIFNDPGRMRDYDTLAQKVFTRGDGDPMKNLISGNYKDIIPTGDFEGVRAKIYDAKTTRAKQEQQAVPALVTSIVNTAPIEYINSNPEYRQLAEKSVWQQLTNPYFKPDDDRAKMVYDQSQIVDAAQKLWGGTVDAGLFAQVMDAKKEIQLAKNKEAYSERVLSGYDDKPIQFANGYTTQSVALQNKYKELFARWNMSLRETTGYAPATNPISSKINFFKKIALARNT